MELLFGIIFLSLQYCKCLLPVIFAGRAIYHFVLYRDLQKVLTKAIAFLLATALMVGVPLGLIDLKYPDHTKAFVKEERE